MKIFLASRSQDTIRRTVDAGLVDGIVISQAALYDGESEEDLREHLTEITHQFALPILASVGAVTSEDIYRQARDLAKYSDQLVVEIPFVEDAVIPIRRLAADGVAVCATFIYTGAQALLAAKCGAVMVNVGLDMIENQGQRCEDVIRQVRTMLDVADLECDLMVSAARGSTEFTESVIAGADLIVVTPEILSSLLVHSLTDASIDRFLRDLTQRHKSRSSQ